MVPFALTALGGLPLEWTSNNEGENNARSAWRRNQELREQFSASPPPISEGVLNYLDTFVPTGPPIIPSPPPIRESSVGEFVGLVLDEFLPSPPPIREGFTDGLHDIISVFQDVSGPGLGEGFTVF